jgi:hypothetical protein
MTEFRLSPVLVREADVSIQVFADSSIRKRGFCGMLNFTREEFEDFRGALMKGVKNNKNASLSLHPRLMPE